MSTDTGKELTDLLTAIKGRIENRNNEKSSKIASEYERAKQSISQLSNINAPSELDGLTRSFIKKLSALLNDQDEVTQKIEDCLNGFKVEQDTFMEGEARFDVEQHRLLKNFLKNLEGE